MDDYFAVFGLPRKLGLDPAELQRRFYELSRRHHPDFHQASPAEIQAEALAASALVNRAYRALREPIARVEYLVALEEGRDGRADASARPPAPRDLLQEMLEVQEMLEEAKADGLAAGAVSRLRAERERLRERRAAEEAAILERAGEWDRLIDSAGDRSGLVQWFKQRLAARAYLGTVIADLAETLGDGQETHGSHRRH